MTDNKIWREIRLRCKGSDAETVSDLLVSLGALSVTYEDAEDTPIFEPKLNETPLWPNTEVIGLYDETFDLDKILSILKAILGDSVPMCSETLENKDWVRAWMDNFKPIPCGKKLWICPSWCEIPDKNAVNVMLDPGLAFGTGTHPTTFLCLKFLDSLDLSNTNILDFGCGSGILAIAALKLGAKSASGIDIDPQAIEATKENAKRNNLEGKIHLSLGEDTDETHAFDLVVANILAGPLVELEPTIAKHCRKGTILALSGILDEQTDEIKEAYSADFDFREHQSKDGWSLLIFTKH